MSVLNTIKGKFVSVQQDISDSLRSLKIDFNSRNKSDDAELIALPDLDSASYELLKRYQKSWAQIHQNSDDISKRSQFVDGLITNLFQFMDQQNTALNQFAAEMSGLVQLVADVNTVRDKIVNLEGAFLELESSLVDLEDVCDQCHQLKMKSDHENELKRYQKGKLQELEQVKASLAKTHAAKIQKYEERLGYVLRERQKVFEEAHHEQMIKYMTTGEVDYLPSSPLHLLDLADVEIEQDRTELDEFLGSVEVSELTDPKSSPHEEGIETDDELEAEKIFVLKDEECSGFSDIRPTTENVSTYVTYSDKHQENFRACS